MSTQNQAINSIKFYWKHILGQDKQFIEIDRPMKPKLLPEVLSLGEIKAILEATSNPKNQLIIKIIYGCGLRVGKVTQLAFSAIKSERGLLKIIQAKGKKDRFVPIPEDLILQLRNYYLTYKLHYYLFEGLVSEKEKLKPYSVCSIRKFF